MSITDTQALQRLVEHGGVVGHQPFEIGMYVHACAEAVEGSVVRASSSAYPRQNSSVGMNPAARVMTTCGVPMAACTPHSTA